MKVISVVNYKGGVGKTTVTSNLAAGLAKRKYKVLAIDLDPQSNLTFSFFNLDEWKDKYAQNKTIKNWFESKGDLRFENLILNPNNVKDKNLNIISSHIGLIYSDIDMACKISSISNKNQKENYIKLHDILKDGIKELRGYDIVLIDCPPSFNMITRNGIVASDYYLVPIKLDRLSTLGLEELNKHIKELEKDYNDNLKNTNKEISPKFLGVVCNMVTRRKEGLISTEEYYLSQLKQGDIPVFNSMLRENKSVYGDAPKEGIPVTMRKLNSQYNDINKELDNLVNEFLERIGM
ncbi:MULTISPECIES: ParA family protein [unclassified Romboutsia]|uniref:ParA family protein n=1 Tax=unclassified Romboutsia TaxID=2626894 RepID=UPI000821409E|nr:MULTISPECIES: AAA family ATPase [unclassified Romboutsia]SCH47725.1 Sporulation initiation inhibitor protein soj [uncultured Clostridium sp.]